MTPRLDDRTTTDEPITELIRGLFGDARELAVAHLDGMRLEMRQELGDLKAASRNAAISIALFAIASILLAFAVVHALWMYAPLPQWAAYAIVGALFVGLGVVAIKRATRTKDIDLVPDEELQKTKQDATWLARRTRDAVS